MARKPSTCSWSNSSSTFAGTSSATRISGTCVIGAAAVHGTNEESGAQNPCVLRHVGDVRRAIRAREREIDARAAARHRNAEAEAVVRLVHIGLVRLEGENAMPVAQAQRKLLPEQARCAHLRAHAPVPSIDRLDLRLRKAVHGRPPVPLGVRREQQSRDAAEHRADAEPLRHARAAQRGVVAECVHRATCVAGHADRQEWAWDASRCRP